MKVKSRFKPKIKNKRLVISRKIVPRRGVIIDLFIHFTLMAHRKKTVKFFLYHKIG